MILFLAEEDVYSWGLNQHGQCSVSTLTEELKLLGENNFKVSASGHITHVYLPVKVMGVASAKEVHCGWSHTLAITGKVIPLYNL